MKTYAPMNIIIPLSLLSLISLTVGQALPNQDPYPNVRFSPSMAIIIVVLIAALFFMGFFSIYVRQCSDSRSVVGQNVRPITGRSRRVARGLDAAVIESFPTFPYSEVKELKIGKGVLECAVCLMEFEDHETLRLIPKCDHVFHPDCIDAWLASHTTCPVCRADLLPEPNESPPRCTESTAESDLEAQNNLVTNEEDDHELVQCQRPPEPVVISVNHRLDANRTRGSRLTKFPRSHSTGHSLIQPGENIDRFTLRLPVEVREEIMNRQLNRATSLLLLPREGTLRRGVRSFEKWDRSAKSDRWVFSMAPPFLTRASSVRLGRSMAYDDEGSSRRSNRQELSMADSNRPPV